MGQNATWESGVLLKSIDFFWEGEGGCFFLGGDFFL